ncbi:MAG: 3-dehydroquinate synthase [Flavobacteriia bacterium]|nr:MAG: 3-dehydroquinate synthase [Flavobacteriia bacterium]
MSNVLFRGNTYQYLNKYCKKIAFSKVIVVVDENTSKICLPVFENLVTFDFDYIEIKPGEAYKNMISVQNIWQKLIDLEVDRNSLIINLGGGVVTDMGGFAALTYKRGLPYINIPTTLLGMVDAAIGGKTGVDFNGLKNQIGVIQEPLLVGIDPVYLKTLPQRECLSGMGEVYKYGFMADAKLYQTLQSYKDTYPSDEVIKRCVNIKKNIVSQDLTEQGVRKTLNFGHTLGHAIESYFLTKPEAQQLRHGEAVAIGMIMALYLSHVKTGLPEEVCREGQLLLKSRFSTPQLSDEDQKHIITYLKHDKKNRHDTLQFVLLKNIGQAVWNITVTTDEVYQAFENYQRLLYT